MPLELGADRYRLVPGSEVLVSVRPADGDLLPADDTAPTAPNTFTGTVRFVRDLGGTTECYVDVGLAEPVIVLGAARHVEHVRQGDAVRVRFAGEACTVVSG